MGRPKMSDDITFVDRLIADSPHFEKAIFYQVFGWLCMIIPGGATMIAAGIAKDIPFLLIGFLQLITAPLLIGWLSSINTGVNMLTYVKYIKNNDNVEYDNSSSSSFKRKKSSAPSCNVNKESSRHSNDTSSSFVNKENERESN